jgi:hypothetical protein
VFNFSQPISVKYKFLRLKNRRVFSQVQILIGCFGFTIFI